MTEIAKWNGFTIPSGGSLGGCLVYLTSSDTIGENAWSTIWWDAEDYDTDSYWSTSNRDRVYFPAAGRYRVFYTSRNACSLTGVDTAIAWQARVRVNTGSTFQYPVSSVFAGTHYRFSSTYSVPTDNYLLTNECFLDISNSFSYCQFQVFGTWSGASGVLVGTSGVPNTTYMEVERIS